MTAGAQLLGPITEGEAIPPIDPRGVSVEALGYHEEEWFVRGEASSYRPVGDHLGADGRWDVAVDARAPFCTRIVVRRPRDPGRFSGVVLVEWLNVSAIEAAPEWTYLDTALVDGAIAWVGVSAQALGVVGGAALMDTGRAPHRNQGGIRAERPERYGALEHPGDAFSFDLFGQVAEALRGPDGATVLGGVPRCLLAAGQSQSAGFLTSFVNAVQPLRHSFDGFFVHGRGSGVGRLDGTPAIRRRQGGYRLRDDNDVPILVFETETDVGPTLGYAQARQPDHGHLRVWEAAGTAHADTHLVGHHFHFCGHPINDGPHHFVAKAGFTALATWATGGPPPPQGEPLHLRDDGETIARDHDGIAFGGIRTPSVDVPASALSGEAPAGSNPICALFGSSHPFDRPTLLQRYGSRQHFLDQFALSLDHCAAAGWVRDRDRHEYFERALDVDFS